MIPNKALQRTAGYKVQSTKLSHSKPTSSGVGSRCRAGAELNREIAHVRLIPTLAVLLIPHAVAGDFRLLDFGAPCAEVRQREIEKGATEIALPAAAAGVIAFEAKAFGRQLVVSYFCPNGVLLTGNYYFPAELLAAAAARYKWIRRKLNRAYGSPWLDNSPWSNPELSGPRSEADPRRFMTTWKTNRLRATSSIVPSQEDELRAWRVAIVFSQDAQAERSH